MITSLKVPQNNVSLYSNNLFLHVLRYEQLFLLIHIPPTVDKYYDNDKYVS